jgi:hypothetical protein
LDALRRCVCVCVCVCSQLLLKEACPCHDIAPNSLDLALAVSRHTISVRGVLAHLQASRRALALYRRAIQMAYVFFVQSASMLVRGVALCRANSSRGIVKPLPSRSRTWSLRGHGSADPRPNTHSHCLLGIPQSILCQSCHTRSTC